MINRLAKIRVPVLLCCVAAALAACGKNDDTAEVEEVVADAPVATELLPHQQMAKDILKELVEANTTFTGNTTLPAERLATLAIEAGFPEEDVHVVGASENKGNLIVRLRGREGGRDPLLLLAHIDVVDANPEDWTLDPFTFIEQDGYYYGRGTTDDKDEAAIHLTNLIRLKQEGFQPDRDIIVALTADEESVDFSDNGVRWLLANRPELIAAEYALNEGGAGAMRDGEYIANTVQASEKVYQSFELLVTNPGGHSSLPVKDNAIYRLADALIRVRAHDFPVTLNEITHAFFERSAELEDGGLADAMRGVLQTPPDPSAVAFLSQTPYYNSRLRTTCVATMLEGGHADNALPQSAKATVNCRMLPTDNPTAILDTLVTVIGDPKVSVTPSTPAVASPPSPLTEDVLGNIEAVTEDMWPGVPVIPSMSTGATDGLYLRNAGIPVYGVTGIFYEMGENRAHGQNERIRIQSFYEGQEFLYRLTKRLSSSDIE